jgi:plasmid stabilization system protein ParE
MKKYNLIRTNQFDESLRNIIAYIKSDSPINASRFLEGVFDAIDDIVFFPEKAAEIGPNIRVKLYKGYWLPYFINGDDIFLLDILHPRQDSKAQKYRIH